MPQNKKDTIAQRRSQVSELRLQGLTQQQMAEKLGVTQQQISNDIKKLREKWLKNSNRNTEEIIAEQVIYLERVKSESLQAWEKSKGKKGKSITQVATKKPNKKSKGDNSDNDLIIESIVQTAKEVAGDPRFLESLLKALRDEAKLLGLDAPEQLEVKNKTNYTDMSAEELSAERKKLKEMIKKNE